MQNPTADNYTYINHAAMSPSSGQDISQVIEYIAQMRTKYENICEAQAAELRKDKAKYYAAYKRALQLPELVKPGGRWIPDNAAEREERLRQMDEICRMEPMSFDEYVSPVSGRPPAVLYLPFMVLFIPSRMKISFAAHGVLRYIISLYMNELPTDAQLRILRRSAELTRETLELEPHVHEPLRRAITPPTRGPLMTPMAGSSISAAERHSFDQDPFQLIGRKFLLLSAEDPDGQLYEVVEVGLSKGKGRWYQLMFEDCGVPIEVGGPGMMEMLQDSVSVGP